MTISTDDAQAVQSAFNDIESGIDALRQTCAGLCAEHGVPNWHAFRLDKALAKVRRSMNSAHELTELIGGYVGVEGGIEAFSGGGNKTRPED